MKQYHAILLLIIGALILTSCTKDTPPCCDCPVLYSETGRNIVGCKMDGDPWRICYKGDPLKAPTSVYRDNNYGRNFWKIKCNKLNSEIDERLIIQFNDPKIGAGFGISFENESKESKYIEGAYDVDQAFPYHMEITHFDNINRIVSGRFECTLTRFGSIKDTIKVTEGVFDTHY